jgi:putative ABC transport system substrate-binding protein
MRRRKFIKLMGAAAAWPLAASAQQPAVPVIGFLHSASPGDALRTRLAAFRQGLAEGGYIEGQNVTIEYRWAEGQLDRLPELAADLIRRQVNVIAVPGSDLGAVAAKAATKTIPIVFGVADDPVSMGLVANLARPGGNATGINFLAAEVITKRVGLLSELVPDATRFGVLVNALDSRRAADVIAEVQSALSSAAHSMRVLKAATSDEIDMALATFAGEGIDALFVGPDQFFGSRRVQFAIMAARYRMPASYALRDYVEAGGLMSYGTNISDMYRQVAGYAAKILKGAKPFELPVVQSTTFELVISRQAAKALDLAVPDKLLARADEVIE